MKDDFFSNLIKYNLKIRFKDNTLFKNLSRDFIKKKYLTNTSELIDDIPQNDVKIIYSTYYDVVKNTIKWLKTQKFKTLIQSFVNDSYDDYTNDTELIYFKNKLSRSHIINSIFQKGVRRIYFLYNFVDGQTINNKQINNWDILTKEQKCILSMEFIITGQIFGDGNHRTSKYMKNYYDIKLSDKYVNHIINTLSNKKYDTCKHILQYTLLDISSNEHDDIYMFYHSWGNIINKYISL